MAGDYELLPSAAGSFSPPRSDSAPSGTVRRHGSSLEKHVKVLVALALKNPWLALFVCLSGLALAHEVLSVGGRVLQLVLPGDQGLHRAASPYAWKSAVEGHNATSATGAATLPGASFRDYHPIQSARRFLQLAEDEITALKLDTCGDKLGRKLAESYNSTSLPYCSPTTPGTSKAPSTEITCTFNYHSPFLEWWPYPAAICLSKNILGYPRLAPDEALQDSWHLFRSQGCQITPKGEQLLTDMASESFVGTQTEDVDPDECSGGRIEHPILIHGRQDQWNPYHVAEDFVTTYLAMIIGSMNRPSLLEDNQRLQLVFSDEFEVSRNHFTAVWDRIGAFAPRRISLDPFEPRTCLSDVIHSKGAGASLLSATGVSKEVSCASALTWGAAHFYRNLFGLPPSAPKPAAVNVLWLSRAKMDRIALATGDWSPWRATRHILNEPELIARVQRGLAGLCKKGRCRFSMAEREPERWALAGGGEGGELELRFGVIDPTTQAIETQIDFVGHTTILMSLHGGALGLSLFLAPGPGSYVVELKPPGTEGQQHFHNMAAEMGVTYATQAVDLRVDVERVWKLLKAQVEVELEARRART